MVVFCSRVVQKMPLGNFFDELYSFALTTNGIGLTDEEIGLLTAIMIMNPGQLFSIFSSLFSDLSATYRLKLVAGWSLFFFPFSLFSCLFPSLLFPSFFQPLSLISASELGFWVSPLGKFVKLFIAVDEF